MWLAVFLALATASGAPKEKTPEALALRTAYEQPRVVVAALGGDVIYPGVRGGLEIPLHVGVRDRWTKRRKRLRNGIGEIIATPTVGTWVEPRNAVLVFGGAEIGARWTGHRAFRYGLHLGAAYLHAFNGGASYHVADDGRVRSAPLAGRPAFMPSVMGELGFDFGRHHPTPLAVSLRGGVFLQLPFNTAFLPGALVEVAFSWRLRVSE